MAVSNQHKLIFVHIPKCGGSSIEKQLASFTKLTLMSKERIPDADIKSKNLYLTGNLHTLEKHLSALEIKNLVGDEIFENYYKFSMVRNPFSRLVSFYNFIKGKKNPDSSKLQVQLVLRASNFKDFILSALVEENMNLFFNQYKYIFDEQNNNLMDFTGKLENITEDYETILKNISYKKKKDNILSIFSSVLNNNKSSLPHINQSKLSEGKSYRNYYDSDLRKKVENACEKDLNFFKYEF